MNLDIKNFLANIAENQSFIEWTYLNDTDNVNFKEMSKHLYDNDNAKMSLLNPWCSLASITASKYSAFLRQPYILPDVFKHISFPDVVNSILTSWYIYFSLWQQNWKPYIFNVDPSEYHFDEKTKSHTITKIYKKDNSFNCTYYAYVQTIKGNIIKNKLYELSALLDTTDWKSVALSTIYQTVSPCYLSNIFTMHISAIYQIASLGIGFAYQIISQFHHHTERYP